MESLSSGVRLAVEDWLKWDENERTQTELRQLLETNPAEVERRFSNRLKFGTAGLRSRMGAGPSMLNDLTVVQATQGVCVVLKQRFSEACSRGVVVGFDGRHNSRAFALLAANVLTMFRIKPFLYRRPVCTPFVPFGVNRLNAACGIMITASHNPKDDNGYKVFWDNGAQITSPIDTEIAAAIEENQAPLEGVWKTDKIAVESESCPDPFRDSQQAYFAGLANMCYFKEDCSKCTIKFTYTAMHGVGLPFAIEAFQTVGLPPFIQVAEQCGIDPDFPTVKFPNPEEGREALDLSMSTANRNGSTVILANDPDADRLAVAEKQPDGKWRVFSGNELGALFGWFLWLKHSLRYPGTPASSVCMTSSTVSSQILRSIAKKERFVYEETLTGFKWMGNCADKWIKKGVNCLFAFEEAIGFMCGSHVLDKDGISGLSTMAELCAYLQQQHNGRRLSEQLMEIYRAYGFHLCYTSYYLCYEPPTVVRIFERIRNFKSAPKTYPDQVCGVGVVGIRDLTVGYDSTTADNLPVLPTSATSQLITFQFSNDTTMTLRTSGTEPKIKFYSERICDNVTDYAAEVEAVKEFVTAVAIELLRPAENGLIAQS